jgi:uncharacterized tellurite resistance protein B-like protein
MSKSSLILTIAKVVIAAAWADGEISNDEINSLKDLLFHLPDMTGREWAMLEMYMSTPIGEAERKRLIAELQEELTKSSERDMAIKALESMIRADGEVTEREKLVAQEIREAIEDADSGVFTMIGRLMKGPVERRSTAVAAAPNREQYFEDYIKNRVYYGVHMHMDAGEAQLEISDQLLRKLSLAAGLMARVAHIDESVSATEKESIVLELQQVWDLDPQAADFVADVALAEVTPDMDYYRLTRSFFESTTDEERTSFLDILFAVASADGFVSSAEIEEIRALSLGFKLPHKVFIDAKLKIPRAERAN